MDVKKEVKSKDKALDIVKKKIVHELEEDSVKVNIEGLVSIMNEERVLRYDLNENTVKDIIQDCIQRRSGLNSFFLLDIGAIFRRYKLWKKCLPKIDIYYAVKCNPDKILLQTLSYLNVGFDVASKAELSMIYDLDINSDAIIFANPVKEIDHIMYARSIGINMMTFDNEDELKKISVFHPKAQLVLRIQVDDSKAKMPFGSKFGCPMNNLKNLFTLGKQLNISIIGVSFHVGSCCQDAIAYADAIHKAKEVFNLAETYDYKFNVLDIGGGFPGVDNQFDDHFDDHFEDIANIINTAIETHFSDVPNLKIIAEPGRFFATSCGTLVTNVIGKKQIQIDENLIYHYYINSNLYGMFNNIVFDKAIVYFNLLNKYPDEKFNSTIFGQTCDSMDKIKDSFELPELACGDWLYVLNHGAYTIASGSTFNGFNLADVKYIYTY
jgi:ornithine decarboxylase